MTKLRLIYFAFFVLTPLTLLGMVGIIAGPVLIAVEMLDCTTKRTAGLGAAAFTLSLLILQWSSRWINRHKDLMDQLI